MNVPDLISPIVGHRVWTLDGNQLYSLNHTGWLPGTPQKAECGLCKRSEPPTAGCSCGVYAARDRKHLVSIGYAEYGICGEVNLWGKVVEHELGYRAQFAYPKTLDLRLRDVPRDVGLRGLPDWIAIGLGAYGVPITFEGESMWSEGQLGGSGFDLLLRRLASVYSSGVPPTLTVGDRVAVTAMGIGIVESITTGGTVGVHMWNRLNLLFSVQKVWWIPANNRFEVSYRDAIIGKIPRS